MVLGCSARNEHERNQSSTAMDFRRRRPPGAGGCTRRTSANKKLPDRTEGLRNSTLYERLVE